LVMENEVPNIPAGRRFRLTRGNGVTTDFVYDNASRLTEIVHRKPDGTGLSSFAYTFDPAGNITRMAFANGDVAQYDYDAKDQLTGEHRRGTLNYDIIFSYDPVGNRLTQSRQGAIKDPGSITYSYNAGDELLTETGRNYINTYTHDPNGNTTAKTNKQTIGPKNQKKEATERYIWDFENRMLGYDAPLGDSAKDSVYTYYADWWNRTQKTVHNNIERYLYDFDEILCDYNKPGNLKALYVNGPIIDERLALLRDGALYYYLTDHLGSVRQLIDTCGTVRNSYDYEAFGTCLGTSGGEPGRYGFAGRDVDKETQAVWMRARCYIGGSGRFLTRDPGSSGGTSNDYLYVSNRPTLLKDPSGLQAPVTFIPRYVTRDIGRRLEVTVNIVWLGVELKKALGEEGPCRAPAGIHQYRYQFTRVMQRALPGEEVTIYYRVVRIQGNCYLNAWYFEECRPSWWERHWEGRHHIMIAAVYVIPRENPGSVLRYYPLWSWAAPAPEPPEKGLLVENDLCVQHGAVR